MQSFKGTLQYFDEWRKFTSAVGRSVGTKAKYIIHIHNTLIASCIYKCKYAQVRVYFIAVYTNITIFTIHIDLSLIRVFDRTNDKQI